MLTLERDASGYVVRGESGETKTYSWSWDWPFLAEAMGWFPTATDADEIIAQAQDFLDAHLGASFLNPGCL